MTTVTNTRKVLASKKKLTWFEKKIKIRQFSLWVRLSKNHQGSEPLLRS